MSLTARCLVADQVVAAAAVVAVQVVDDGEEQLGEE